MNYWDEKLKYSLGQQQEFDIELLKQYIPDSVSVVKTNVEQDKKGIDYVVTLNGGATINIDAKTREPGCSKYWINKQPELALEIWSVKEKKIIGWTLNTKTQVDYILYTFAREDCASFFLLPFQLLRKAFKQHGREWVNAYKSKLQKNKGYYSEAVFVPANVVLQAVSDEMAHIIRR